MFCVSTRPRYHVSVYRNIGPLVLTWSFLNLRLSSFRSEILGSAVACWLRSRTPDPEV